MAQAQELEAMEDDWFARAGKEISSPDWNKIAEAYDRLQFEFECWATGQPMTQQECDEMTDRMKLRLEEMQEACQRLRESFQLRAIF